MYTRQPLITGRFYKLRNFEIFQFDLFLPTHFLLLDINLFLMNKNMKKIKMTSLLLTDVSLDIYAR